MGIVPRGKRFGGVPDHDEVPVEGLAESVAVLPESDRVRLEAYLDALIEECGAGLRGRRPADVVLLAPARRVARRRLRSVVAGLPVPLTGAGLVEGRAA